LIWYQTVRDPRVTEGTRFAEFAAVTIDVAKRLPGTKAAEGKAVADAWAQVGVVVTS
jgi:Zn-dependent metalloprotease